jgi:hypothetical protein
MADPTPATLRGLTQGKACHTGNQQAVEGATIMWRFRLRLGASRISGAISPFFGSFDEADRAHLRLLETLREAVVLLDDHEEAERIAARMAAAAGSQTHATDTAGANDYAPMNFPGAGRA